MVEMFQGGVHRATRIRRAVVIGNGFAGAENQSIGLVRALGLWGRQSLYCVRQPRGGINEWVHWLPLPLHKKVVPSHLSFEKLDHVFSHGQLYVALSRGVSASTTKVLVKKGELHGHEGVFTRVYKDILLPSNST